MRVVKNITFFSILGVFWFLFLLYPVTQGIFFFAFDQSRDLLWVKDQIELMRPLLIGPWASLEGVFFGPLWFWLLVIPYVVSGGSPIATTLFNGIIIYMTAFVALLVFWKTNRILATSVFLLILLSPGLRLLASYAFSQHLLPLLTLMLIYCYVGLLQGKSMRYLYGAFFILSLFFHAEPPTGVASLLSLPVIMLFSPLKQSLRSPRVLGIAAFVFLIPFTPLVLFDIRHDFIQIKALLSYIQGANESLGATLPFSTRIIDRITKFFDNFRLTFFYTPTFFAYIPLLLLGFVHRVWNKNSYMKKVLIATGLYLLTFFISFIIYGPELKGFYLDGIFIVFIVIASSVIALFWTRSLFAKTIITSFILFLLIQQTHYTVSLLSGVERKKAYQSGSLFTNQREIVDWIYTKANKKGFYAYTYSAALFDYPYQYLFMWYGAKAHYYLPLEFSYLPNKPEYVPHKTEYLLKNKNNIKTPAAYLFLIIEADNRKELVNAWLSNFSESTYASSGVKIFSDGTRVEMRTIAKN